MRKIIILRRYEEAGTITTTTAGVTTTNITAAHRGFGREESCKFIALLSAAITST